MFADRPHLPHAALALAGMAVTILTALGFEHLGGYIPCALCLMERWPYYLALPVAAVATGMSARGTAPHLTRVLLGLVGLAMLVGLGMAIYHSGVEWKFWEGPSACAGSTSSVPSDASDILGQLNTIHGPSCADAPWRLLGLSFAGWNMVTSLVLAAIALTGAARKPA